MKIVVAGAGISGCIASWVMQKAGHDVRMICPSGKVGGEDGPWRLHPESAAFREMLTDLGVFCDDMSEKPHGAVALFYNDRPRDPGSDEIRPFMMWEATEALPDDLYEKQARKIWPIAELAVKAMTVFSAPEILKPRIRHLDFSPAEFYSKFEAEPGTLHRLEQSLTGKIAASFITPSGRFTAHCDAFILAAPWSILPVSFRTDYHEKQWSIGRDLWHATTHRPANEAEERRRWIWLANDYLLTPDLPNVLRLSHSLTGAWVEAVPGASPDEIQSEAANILGPCDVHFVRKIAGLPQGRPQPTLPRWMLAIGPHALSSQMETPDSTLNRCVAFAQRMASK